MITNIREAAKLVGKGEATLHRWRKSNPNLFQAVIEYAARHKEEKPSK